MDETTERSEQSESDKQTKKPPGRKVKRFRKDPWDPGHEPAARAELENINERERYLTESRSKSQAWAASVLLSVAAYFLTSADSLINLVIFLSLFLVLLGFFYAQAVALTVRENRLLDRAREIEEILRTRKRGYYGPVIGVLLVQRVSPLEFRSVARLQRVYLPFLLFAVLITLMTGSKIISLNSRQSSEMSVERVLNCTPVESGGITCSEEFTVAP